MIDHSRCAVTAVFWCCITRHKWCGFGALYGRRDQINEPCEPRFVGGVGVKFLLTVPGPGTAKRSFWRGFILGQSTKLSRNSFKKGDLATQDIPNCFFDLRPRPLLSCFQSTVLARDYLLRIPSSTSAPPPCRCPTKPCKRYTLPPFQELCL